MIPNKIYPNINIFSNINASMPIDDFSLRGFGASNLKAADGANFKDVLSGMVSNLNTELHKPDQLLQEQMMGNQDVDIHDITAAIAKAEIGVSLATQMTSKVVTAYNTIMNISI